MPKINLGDEVRDTITGFKGIAVARTQWITGCDRIAIQPKVDKDGKLPENATFDEINLEIIKAKKIPKEKKVWPDDSAEEKGGPRQNFSYITRK